MMKRWDLFYLLLSCAVGSFMVFGQKPVAYASDDSRVAVLQTRADQIDQHVHATDESVQRLWDTIQAQGRDLSEMQGEERAAFAILTLLTAGNFVVQIGRRKKEDAS